MHSTVSIPRRPERGPPARLLALLLVATGCGAGERENDRGDGARAPVAIQATGAEVVPGPAPETAVPLHLDRASLRVLGMT